ncbi:MAG: hypothetical protein AB1898_25750 [Acidobacteriota bacterium]
MFSKIVRRSHMYLALFLTPWMLIYALSTMAMNHREWFRHYYGGPTSLFEKESERVYSTPFPSGATPQAKAIQILGDLGLEGAHSVNASKQGQQIMIYRNDPVIPRRITYSPADQKLVIEREQFRTPSFLERMHRRRGFQQPYLLDGLWGVSVDLVIVGMIFWVLSGLWMWWELRSTRLWGAAFSLAGFSLFSFFLIFI